MKKLLMIIGLMGVLTSCHQDKDSYLTITVLDSNEDRQVGITVDMKPAQGGDAEILFQTETTDEDGEVVFILEDWGNGSAWGTTVEITCLSGSDTLEISEPRNGQIHVHQDSQQYWGQDFKETIILK
jgi:hypothetical protein